MCAHCFVTSLRKFYTELAGAPYLERGEWSASESKPDAPEGQKVAVFLLTPVGIETQPADIAQLHFFLRCAIEAIAACHAKCWALVDLRWSNVIRTSAERWFLIDAAEHATPFGRAM